MNSTTASRMMQLGLEICFLWFGMLKFFSGLSPAETLAVMTIDRLTFSIIPSEIAIKLLAVWEVAVGIGFLFGKKLRWIVALFLVHMTFTFAPLILFPEICFTQAPFALTLVGQYIVKNIVLIMGGIIIYILETEKQQ